MIYIQTNPEDESSSLWLFDMGTLTLAELLLAALPGGSHLLTVEAGQPPPDEAFRDFAKYLETICTGASKNLAIRTRATGVNLPNHLIMIATDTAVGGCIIHYPNRGLTAGIRGDGTKINPVWTHSNHPSSTERTALLKQAAETLSRAFYDLSSSHPPN